jgi:TetR/AcrR family transcriptional regulator, cholesterol catabolism regulator
MAAEREPWARLEKAVIAHLESILDASAYARVVIRILPSDAPEIATELKELRDRYEARLSRCFSAIALPRERDATIARLALLGAMNWTPVWYREGGKSMQAIARELLAPLRALAGIKAMRSRK